MPCSFTKTSGGLIIKKLEVRIKKIEMVSCPIQLRMNDLDVFNHVNNGAQCHILDYGRTQFFEKTLGRHIEWLTFDLVLVHIDMDFKEPIMIHDEIVCETEILEIGTKSVRLEQRLRDALSGAVKTVSHSVAVSINRETGHDAKPTSKPLSEEYIEKFKNEIKQK